MALSLNIPRKVLVLILAVLAIIMCFILIYVQFNVLRELRVEVANEELALSSAQQRLNNLIEHRNRAPEYQQRLDYAESLIPGEPKEDEVLRYLNWLANEFELQAIEIRFGARSVSGTVTVMPLSVTLEGSYLGLRYFLKELYEGERVFRVDNMRISRTGGTGTEIRVALSLNAFYKHGN